MMTISAQDHPLNALSPSLLCWAMPWVVLVVELLLLSIKIFSFVVEVLLSAVWLICCLCEWLLKCGWSYLDF